MRKHANAIWNQMHIPDRLEELAGGYLSESDKDYRTTPPEPAFLRSNWQQVPAYVKDRLLRKWGFK